MKDYLPYIRELEEALARSNPWNKDDNDYWRCIHCDSTYDWNNREVSQPHNPLCIWMRAGGDDS